MKNRLKSSSLHLALAAILLLTACGSPDSNTSPTPNVTQALETVNARLTEAAAQTPAASPTPQPSNTLPATLTPTNTVAATNTLPAAPTNTAGAVVNSCDVAAAGNPIDVTIPDDTQMSPGANFTKTWRLKNAGTCTWTKAAYTVALASGNAMGAPISIPLPADVPPGQSIDISVNMVAPTIAGTYQGDWKLRNGSNVFFGIGGGGGSPFWVRIVVNASLTSVATTAAATSGTAAATTAVVATTPAPGTVLASGSKTMADNDGVDLDGSFAGSKRDLVYNAQSGADRFTLTPINNAAIGLFGAAQPTQAQCQATAKSGAPISVMDYGNMYLCVQTDSGHISWVYLELLNINNLELTIRYTTWY